MGVHVYPVTENGLFHNGYRVWINEEPVALNTARVSAVPFNRRWPGHQRPIDQTELVNFLSLEMGADEPLRIRVQPTEPFDPARLEIRPASLGIKPAVTDDGMIEFTLPRPVYCTLEPYGRHNALHIFADPPASYGIDPTDPDVLYYGPGEHDVGQIELKSGQTLFLDAGAVVYACVRAKDAKNIRILGRGILDNSRNREKILFEVNAEDNRADVGNAERQHTVQLEYCENVEIEGVTIRDSLVYNIRPIACERLRISNVKLIGNWRYNSDGIDMHNCVDVEISHCFIRTFDDCVCVKGFDCFYGGDVEKAVHEAMYRGGKAYDVFRRVRVRDCTIWNDWGKCLEIGAETRAEEICDVTFEDCHVIHATHKVLDCMNVDYADVHDVTYRNVEVEFDDPLPDPRIQKSDRETYAPTNPDYAPPVIAASVVFHHEYSAGGTRRGKNRNFLFENISLRGRQKPTFSFVGYDAGHTCENMTVRGFSHNGKPLEKGDYALQVDETCKNITVE